MHYQNNKDAVQVHALFWKLWQLRWDAIFIHICNRHSDWSNGAAAFYDVVNESRDFIFFRDDFTLFQKVKVYFDSQILMK